MAGSRNRKGLGKNNMALGFLFGAVAAAIAVLGYFALQENKKDVIRIDVPGFSGEIVTDKKHDGSIDIEGRIGRD